MARTLDPRILRIAERAPRPAPPPAPSRAQRYVDTLVGESTSREFRLAINQEAVREQDIVAIDAELRRTDAAADGPAPPAAAPAAVTYTASSGRAAASAVGDVKERIRVWAKVQ